MQHNFSARRRAPDGKSRLRPANRIPHAPPISPHPGPRPARIASQRPLCYVARVTAERVPAPVSVADYLAGEKVAGAKHEYLGGHVHAMAGGSNRHNTIALNSLLALGRRLAGAPCRPFNSDTKVRVDLPDQVRFYYPDAMVVCDPNSPEEHYQERPVVLVEVLSESTRRIDLGEKRGAYLAIPSLRVLILAESEGPAVTVHRRKPDGGFAVEEYAGLDAAIPLPEIGAALPLAELYAGAGFGE